MNEKTRTQVSVSRANQAAAFARISQSILSRRFSRRRRRGSARSSVLRPSSRLPRSRSSCLTRLRMAWTVGSNSLASASQAAAGTNKVHHLLTGRPPDRSTGSGHVTLLSNTKEITCPLKQVNSRLSRRTVPPIRLIYRSSCGTGLAARA